MRWPTSSWRLATTLCVPVGAADLKIMTSQRTKPSRVIYYIKEHYVDPSRVFPKEMFVAAVEEIEKSVPEVLVDAREHSVAVTVGDQDREFRIDNLDQPWEVAMALRDVFGFLQDKVAEGTELRDIEYAAINGLLSTLDPHSVLFTP